MSGRDHALSADAATHFCWLIEAPGAHYLAARKLAVHEFFWTKDHNRALRFFSAEHADLTMMAVRALAPALFEFARTLGEARPVEHGWLNPNGLDQSPLHKTEEKL